MQLIRYVYIANIIILTCVHFFSLTEKNYTHNIRIQGAIAVLSVLLSNIISQQKRIHTLYQLHEECVETRTVEINGTVCSFNLVVIIYI